MKKTNTIHVKTAELPAGTEGQIRMDRHIHTRKLAHFVSSLLFVHSYTITSFIDTEKSNLLMREGKTNFFLNLCAINMRFSLKPNNEMLCQNNDASLFLVFSSFSG